MRPIIELNAERVIKRRARQREIIPEPVPEQQMHVFLNNVAVRRNRKLTGLTQAEIAGIAGLTPSRMSEYERKSVYVHVYTANMLARALGTDVRSIVRRTEDMHEQPC